MSTVEENRASSSHQILLSCRQSCCLFLPWLTVTIIFTSFLRDRAPSTPSSRELHHLPVLPCEDSCCLPCSVLLFLAVDATFAAASVDLFPPLLLLQSCLAAAALMDFRWSSIHHPQAQFFLAQAEVSLAFKCCCLGSLYAWVGWPLIGDLYECFELTFG